MKIRVKIRVKVRVRVRVRVSVRVDDNGIILGGSTHNNPTSNPTYMDDIAACIHV